MSREGGEGERGGRGGWGRERVGVGVLKKERKRICQLGGDSKEQEGVADIGGAYKDEDLFFWQVGAASGLGF